MDKKKSYKMIRVIWTDATSTDEWTSIADIKPELHRIVTVGHLQQETKEAIVVALSHDPSGESCSSFISIPKAWIESRCEIVQKKRRSKKK